MRSSFLIFPVFCLFLVGVTSAQERSSTVPGVSPIPCNSRSFSIPFEVRNEGVADPPKEIELLYSTDRGVRWFSFKRVPVDAGKFDFTASNDGEYWFIFRTITLSGLIKSTSQSGQQLRVLVDTSSPNASISADGPVVPTFKRQDSTAPSANVLRSAEDSSPKAPPEPPVVPITPPKPSRQVRNEATSKKPSVADESVTPTNPSSPPSLFSPFGEAVPVQQPSETIEKKRPTVDPLLAEMSRFYTTSRETPLKQTVPTGNGSPPGPSGHDSSSEPRVPGTISGVSLADVQQKPRVVVRWDIGDESWRTAHVDVLRGTSPQGPWFPIATNLPNSGEYWWFVTNDDFKPFYVSVRLRVLSGASTVDATRSPIRIDSTLLHSATVTNLR